MCGIAGFIGVGSAFQAGAKDILKRMTDQLASRGPDAHGAWIDAEAGVALGHRRLSIMDLSDAGAQPMRSASGRYMLSFNGEIYNHLEIRDQMPAHNWRGGSDTETLLALIELYGVQKALARLDGMFAFSLYDRKENNVILARDPFGEKPLLWAQHGGGIIFASTLHAFRGFPDFRPELDMASVADYFKYSYVPEPRSIYANVSKIPAGHFLTIPLRNPQTLESVQYWNAQISAQKRRKTRFDGDYDDAISAVESSLQASVKRRMVLDVPLGGFLSGGIDSSLAVALMQEIQCDPIKTFTVEMPVAGFNEAGFASSVAAHIGTDHTTLKLRPEDVQNALPKMAEIYDEPFADSSSIPTYLISKMARSDVTVALTGDGADELFAGYTRHFRGADIWRKASYLPSPVRKAAAHLLAGPLVGALAKFGPADLRAGRTKEKLQKLAMSLLAKDVSAFHDNLVATAYDTHEFLNIPSAQRSKPFLLNDQELSLSEAMMLHDCLHYLPGDILTKTDRASMANGLELRTPYLSRELFELAWSLPMEMKAGRHQGKRILRDILYTKVPKKIVDRPKAGFAIPLGPWLKAELSEWAGDMLSSDSLCKFGFLDANEVTRRWHEHLEGRKNHEAFLWSVLMFQGWSNAAF